MARKVFILFIFLTVSLVILIIRVYSTQKYDFMTEKILQTLANESHVKDLKFILQWTKADTIPFVFLQSGQETFLQRKCRVNNCFVTHDRKYLKDITDFDAILFHGPEILGKNIKRPEKRTENQKYVFVSIESPHYYSDCRNVFNNFFNWTWTYKLNSDVPFNYLTVRDKNDNIIGPRENISWINEMLPIKDDLKDKLKNKTKAAAWFVSNCDSKSKREKVARDLKKELSVFNLTVHVYGKCGDLKCAKENGDCWSTIENNYYFYLAFENSFAPDYVTEKVLNGLLHYAVPVVYGAANYSRFMPDSIYLDITKLGAKEVARRMKDAVDNPQSYHDYFKWHNHYSYEETSVTVAPDSDSYCKLCEMLNAPMAGRTSVYGRFDKWWNTASVCTNLT